MTLGRIVFETIVGKESMRSKWHKTDDNSWHEINVALGQSQHIFLYFRSSRLSLFVLHLLNAKYLVDRSHYITKNVIFWDNIRKCSVSVDDCKLVRILIVPEHFIDSICHKFDMMVGFCCGEEEIDLSILMLEDEFCSIFIWKHS